MKIVGSGSLPTIDEDMIGRDGNEPNRHWLGILGRMRATPRRAQCHIWAKVSVVLGRSVAVGWHCVLRAGPSLHVAFVGRYAQL